MTDLPRSDQALKVCSEHTAGASGLSGTANWAQVEAVLASYVASVIYAEAEGLIRRATAARAARGTTDSKLASFAKIAATRLIRSIKISELAGLLGHFDVSCKEHFTRELTSKQRTDWDSLVGTRHGVAHEAEEPISTLTLSDVREYYASVREVIELFETSLDV